MVKAEQMQDCGMEVVDMDFINGSLVADLIGLTVGKTTLHAAACHPRSEAVGIVVASGLGRLLGHREASKFTRPDDEGIVQQAALA
jgi:hypothetical protein